jgi:hypothetical protein
LRVRRPGATKNEQFNFVYRMAVHRQRCSTISELEHWIELVLVST